MNIFKRTKKERRIWGQNPDGTPYVIGMTVGELRKEISKFDDGLEVCMAVCPKRYWNGGGYWGKLAAIEMGSNQVWLKGRVLDESLE
jgi:hypothetical protein